MFKLIQQSMLVQGLYFRRTEMERLLLLSCAFSVAMSLTRIAYSDSTLFVWLNWNLFLAAVPYLVSRFAISQPKWVESNIRFASLFVTWLLFIPNAFYIITDLFHLDKGNALPLWFDLALIFSFAWNGLLLGILSVRQMEKLVRVKFPLVDELHFVAPIMFLNALGVYIVRYLRYNSWDVVTNPFQLVNDIVYLLSHPIQNRFDWSMIACYSVFMTLIYLAVKRMSKALW